MLKPLVWSHIDLRRTFWDDFKNLAQSFSLVREVRITSQHLHLSAHWIAHWIAVQRLCMRYSAHWVRVTSAKDVADAPIQPPAVLLNVVAPLWERVHIQKRIG